MNAENPMADGISGTAGVLGEDEDASELSREPSPTNPILSAAAPFLTRGVELSGLLTALVEAIVGQIDAERGTLYLVDGSTKTLTSIVAHLPEIERIRLAFGQGVAGVVAETGAPMRVDDAGSDRHFDGTFDQRTGYHTRTLLAVPVRDSLGSVIAVFQALNAKRGCFTNADEERALKLAAQAGQVLEGTSLYTELRAKGPLGDKRKPLAFRFNQIVGESEAMRSAYALVEKAARTSATVLITGESGTGKELIARAVHVNSPRREKPFVKIDCTTLPEALIENELFGHERGAYTGADKAGVGKVEAAEGGTLFIDEIGELPLHVQGKLLRVIQDREFERVGGTKTIRADIRIICATWRNLEKMVDEGRFREDLFYRVRVVPVALPPLRDRGAADLERLIDHFVERFSRRHQRPIERLTPGAMERLRAHLYPGNIRELENAIESAVVLCDGGVIDAKDLMLSSRSNTARTKAPMEDRSQMTLQEVESAHLRLVLEACDGNQSEAARRLGIGRNTLARKLADDVKNEIPNG